MHFFNGRIRISGPLCKWGAQQKEHSTGFNNTDKGTKIINIQT
jgi:hypothetical protein